MPTYQYQCTKCGREFEKFQAISDKSLTVCPKELCGMKKWGKGRVKRLISAGAGLIFKGSGFYITDYRSEKYKEAAKKDAGAAAPAAGGDSKTSDAKPASSKSEAKKEAKPPTKSS
jgi:putative FmdB family regulatory protein